MIQLDILEKSAIDTFKNAMNNIEIDILIHNAGFFPYKTNRAPSLDTKEWLNTFKINAIFPIQLTFALKENIVQAKTKKVIFISSRRASNTINKKDRYEGRYGYRSSKSALNSAAVALAQDLEKYLITVVMVHPQLV